MVLLFSFPSPTSEPFLQELPSCSPLCSLLSSMTDCTWFLVQAFGMFGFCNHCKWRSPRLSPMVAEEEKMITWSSRGTSESSKPNWAFPPSHSLLLRRPPAWPRRTMLLPHPQELGSLLLSHANWAHLVQEQKLLIRENAVMRYFFLFVLLDKLVISSLSYQVSRSSTILSLLLPSRPLPTPEPSRFPPSPPSHTPMPCTAPPTGGHRAAPVWAPGPYQGGLPPRGQASVPSVLFSANARTEREARINSQTDTKQRDRETAV